MYSNMSVPFEIHRTADEDKSESLQELYQRKIDGTPENVHQKGQFNVFRLDPFVGKQAKPVPYKRREFY